ncbi:MAG TPA: hypothetical protein VK559_09675 [Ferruginibacter sp.]|nr:hypothetical protein [Ferruginibacter sp.]
MDIKYYSNKDIDKKKWDDCIANAGNSLIYAYSFYLDNIAKNWDALILNDYEAVMPLTWNKKYGIKYLYQPPFTQQLGIFSKKPVTENTTQQFVALAKTTFKFAEIFLNFPDAGAATKPCANFILALDQPYKDIEANYKATFIKSLKHSKKNMPIYLDAKNYMEVIDAHIKEYSKRTPHVKEKDYAAFANICRIALSKKMLVIKKVISPHNELLAIALLLKDNNRLYNILSAVPKQARTSEANYFLYDELIKEFSGQVKALDFEGSDIRGIAEFYKKFGAVDQPYYFLRYNDLPWPLRYLKG